MKIISCNVNGLRSAYKKGFLSFVKKEKPDIICLQEIKARNEDLPQELLNLKSYHLFFNQAEKKGYSGLVVFTKTRPILVNKKLGVDRFDKEGRLLELHYQSFIIFNLYFPHGGRQKENLDYKLEVYKKVFDKVTKIKNKNVIIMGDFNIAHQEIDLSRPKQNKNNIMFTPNERAQLDILIKLGFTDSFRHFTDETGHFTWWPYAFEARKRNMGWRIDYCFVSRGLSKFIKQATIYPDAVFSDHCPIGLVI